MNSSKSVPAVDCLASEVTSGVPGDQWRGHSPITHDVLLSNLLRAAAGDHNFRHDERILYTVCEFWAAIQARSIVEHLGSRACENVRNAAVAFSAIGATQVGSLLNAVDHDLATAPTRERLLEGLAALEHQLSGALDPVDRLIAGYATAMREGSRTPTSRRT